MLPALVILATGINATTALVLSQRVGTNHQDA